MWETFSNARMLLFVRILLQTRAIAKRARARMCFTSTRIRLEKGGRTSRRFLRVACAVACSICIGNTGGKSAGAYRAAYGDAIARTALTAHRHGSAVE